MGKLKDQLPISSTEEVKAINKSKESITGTVFFLSFDIVNSTQFKVVEPSKWVSKTKDFYKGIKEKIEEISDTARVWKSQGDEVLIYFTINDIKKLYNCIENIYSILKELIKNIQENEGKSLLSVQATLWVALVSEDKKDDQNINLAISSTFQSGYDFIGPDIDFGFRIASKSAGGIICMDPKIVAMLVKSSEKNYTLEHWKKFRLIDFVQLKGIWRDRFVPIIWYHPEIEAPKKIFPYDEKKRNELVKCLLEKKTKSKDALDIMKIFDDLGKNETIDELVEDIGKFSVDIGAMPQNRIAEVHMVAILFNEEKSKTFCAKRSESKPRFPNYWEHGCCQLKRGEESPEQIIKQQYKNDFGIDIVEFKKDYRLENKELYIVCSYSFKDAYGNIIPGFIVTGIAKEFIPENWNKDKHSQLKWMTIEEIHKLDNSECVENFKQHVDLAKKLWD
jgi:NUDIX domain